ncbi:hypothetical protein JCM10207_002173 [Rhodosporidiobolus poonsookiae]
MADVIVYGLAFLAANAHEKFSTYRSPVIPIEATPVPSSDLSPPDALASHGPTPILTEHQLRATHYAWSTRHSAVFLRACALLDAKAKGYPACWAGNVDRETLRAVRGAVDEARWVEERLKKAIEWCDERKMKKMKLVKLVQIRRGRRSAVTRPTHSCTPPTLLDLPFPLPEAPPSNRLALSVPRPPPLEREGAPEYEERNRPPTYTREADVGMGEISLEGGMYDEEVLRALGEADAVEAGLSVAAYERTRM